MDAEVIFETGSKSVLHDVSEEDVKGFALEHQRRALAGDEGGPTGHPAERIRKILLYSGVPGEMYEGKDGTLDASRVSSLVEGMTKNGKVDMHQLVSALRDEASPVYPVNQGRHESLYKAQEDSEMDLSFLDEVDA